MAYIELRNIVKSYEDGCVLKDVSLSIGRGEFVTLLGPSGCGKTTLLRCLAGLEAVDSGGIFLDGEEITYREPRHRNVGMIFQQYSLFPTMTVFKNIAFGLRMRGMDSHNVRERVASALEMVDLAGYEEKYPSRLSGGEQQRVALARCIVTRPKVLLLDEPFSAIDAKLRKALQIRIKEIHRELSMTSVFVTHDQEEAMRMSDTIHLFNDGVIEQSGSPMDLYAHPRTPFAAGFMGNYNILDAQTMRSVTGGAYAGDESAVVRPEIVAIGAEPFCADPAWYRMSGVVASRIPQGSIIRYEVDVGATTILSDVLFDGALSLDPGESVFLKVDRDKVLTYPACSVRSA